MKRFVAVLSLLLLVPLAARADRADDPPPFALRLADSSLHDGALQRASLEKTTGAIFIAVSAISLILSTALAASLWSCPVDAPGTGDCGVGLVLPMLVSGINTIVTGGIGTALLVTGITRQSDALRLGVAPSLNPHGAGMGLTLSF
jgi:hypothetical protein